MKIRVQQRYGKRYEAVLEDKFGFSVFGADSGPCVSAKEARGVLEEMIVNTMKHTGKHVYVFVEGNDGAGIAVFHLYNTRGVWEYAIVRPEQQSPGITIFGRDTKTQESALRMMVSHAKQYGQIIGFCPNYFKDTLQEAV